MKKIYLLFALMVTVIAASAQYAVNVTSGTPAKNSQISTSGETPDGSIENVTVYPNPVMDELKVAFKSNRNGTAVVSLFNNIGKQTFKQESEVMNGSNLIQIDVRNKGIEPGVYFVQITIGNDSFTRKLIVK